jgi:SIR2-like domain
MDLLKENDIIFLLGAGASAEADIPFTSQMIEDLENDLAKDNFKEYKSLYEFLKEQKQLMSGEDITIEELVNVIDELCLLLEKKHPLTLINLSWINFMEKLGYTNKLLRDFKMFIFDKLKDWIPIEDKEKPKYYNNIAKFFIDYDNSMSIFTLNYDKCIEEYCNKVENQDPQLNDGKAYNLFIERGFGNEQDTDENKEWDYKRFIESGDATQRKIYLYKMHGSIDWERNQNDKTERRNNISKIKIFDIIFGTQQKVKAYDPYLFFMYEFREKSLNSKLIIISGYGFGDDHINRILKQAYEAEKGNPYLLVNLYSQDGEEGKNFVKNKLGVNNYDRIILFKGNASTFFQENLSMDYIKEILFSNEHNEDIPY